MGADGRLPSDETDNLAEDVPLRTAHTGPQPTGLGTRPGATLPLIIALGLLAACGGGPEEPLTPVVTDSAGVTIVENPDPGSEVRLIGTLSPEPLVDIGGLDVGEAYQLFRAFDARRLPDGRLAVVNGGSAQILVYDERGLHVGTWGREGEGPGEFRNPFRLSLWPGDSLAVWDFRLRRLSIIDREGLFGRQIHLAQGDWSGLLQWHTAFSDGTSLITHQDVLGETPTTGLRRHPTTAVVLDPGGEPRAELPTQPGDEVYTEASEDRVEVMRLPFLKGYAAATWGEEIVFGPTDRPELRVHDRSGTLIRVIRVDRPLRRITDADWNAEIERMVESAPPEARPGIRARYQNIRRTDTFPAFSQVLEDGLGNLWMELYLPPVEEGGQSRTWMVFDRSGRLLGAVETPPGLRVLQIGADFILGHLNDELEVEHIQVWGLDRD